MAWTPADIDTDLWLDASDSGTITLDGSGNVEQWDDKSGNDRHATQTSAGDRPTISSASINSLDSVQFDSSEASGEHLKFPVQEGESAYSIFVVLQINNDPPLAVAQTGILSTSSTADNSHHPYTDGDLYHHFGSSSRKKVLSGNYSTDLTESHILNIDSASSSWTLRLQGSEVFTTQTNTVDIESPVILGASDLTGDRYLDGRIAEVIIFNAILSESDRQKTEGYLAHKWGLTGNLPSDHPYKTYEPGVLQTGMYGVSGGDAGLVYVKYNIDIGPGAISVSGSDVDFYYPYALQLGPGAISVSGSDVDLQYFNYRIDLSPGEYAAAGSDAGMYRNRELLLGSVTLSVTGAPLGFGLDLTEQATTAVIVYLFTLTGAADGTTDIEIPISTIQARMRSGKPTYLQVTIPGLTEYMAYVNARANGSMKIDVAYLQSGEYIFRETIINVTLQNIRIDEGPFSKSITLTGRSQKTYSNKSITLYRPIYKKTADGALRYRFAEPHVYLFPGDTVTVGTDTFVADNISYYVGARTGGMDTTMEIASA